MKRVVRAFAQLGVGGGSRLTVFDTFQLGISVGHDVIRSERLLTFGITTGGGASDANRKPGS